MNDETVQTENTTPVVDQTPEPATPDVSAGVETPVEAPVAEISQAEAAPAVEPTVSPVIVEQPVQVRLNQASTDSRFTNFDKKTQKYSFFASTLREIETLVDKLGHLHVEVKEASHTYLL